MTVIKLISEFFNVPTLIGIAILSRHATKGWQLVIGVTLVLLGLIVGIK